MMLPLDLFCSDKNSILKESGKEGSLDVSSKNVKFVDLLKKETDSVLAGVSLMADKDKILNNIINKRALLVKEFSEITKTLDLLIDSVNMVDGNSESKLSFPFLQNSNSEVIDCVKKVRDVLESSEAIVSKGAFLKKIQSLIKEIKGYISNSFNENIDADIKFQRKIEHNVLKSLVDSLNVVAKIVIAEDTGSYSLSQDVVSEIDEYLCDTNFEELDTVDSQPHKTNKNSNDSNNEEDISDTEISSSLIIVAESLVDIPEKVQDDYQFSDDFGDEKNIIEKAIRPIVLSRVKEKDSLKNYVINSYRNSIKTEKSSSDSLEENAEQSVSWSNVFDNERINFRGAIDKKIKLHDFDTGISTNLDKVSKEEMVDIEAIMSSLKDKTIKRKFSKKIDKEGVVQNTEKKLPNIKNDIKETRLSSVHEEKTNKEDVVSTKVYDDIIVDKAVVTIDEKNKNELKTLKKSEEILSKKLDAKVELKIEKTDSGSSFKETPGYPANKNKAEKSELKKSESKKDNIFSNDALAAKEDSSQIMLDAKPSVSAGAIAKESEQINPVVVINNEAAIDKLSGMEKMETVSKLDQYKFNQDVVDQVRDKIKMVFRSSIREMKISLNPQNLGEVVIKVQMRDSYGSGEKTQIMNVSFMVDNDSVKDAILSGVESLKQSISETAVSNVANVAVMVRTDINQQQAKHHFSNSLIKSKKKNFLGEIEIDVPDENLARAGSGISVFDYQA